jgi:hypothetical protein
MNIIVSLKGLNTKTKWGSITVLWTSCLNGLD